MSEDPTGRARRVWDGYATRYDRSMRFCERYQFAGGREWVAARASGDVLEVAVGTGLNLRHYPADVRFTGVDLSPGMLAGARERAAQLGRDADLRVGDAAALPFPDASFDTVVCTLGLCTVPDDRAAVGEMWRVLRPGGRVLLLDHVGSDRRVVHALQRLLEVFTRRVGEYQTRRPLPLLVAAGFEVLEAERLKAGTVERVAARRPALTGGTQDLHR